LIRREIVSGKYGVAQRSQPAQDNDVRVIRYHERPFFAPDRAIYRHEREEKQIPRYARDDN